MNIKILLSITVYLYLLCTNLSAGEYLSIKKEWEGVQREYLIYLPSSYKINKKKSYPIIFGLHGYMGTASGFQKETTKGMNLLAEKENIIIVYPQGSHFYSLPQDKSSFVSSWNDLVSNKAQELGKPRKCSLDRVNYPKPPECSNFTFCAWTSCYDDLGFLKSVIEEVSSGYRVDKKRRYMIGMSNGGAMTYRFSCKYPEMLSASIAVSSSIAVSNSCENRADLPMLIIYGSSDRTTPYDGSSSYDGFFYEPVSKLFDNWANGMNCSDKLTSSNLKFSKEKGLICAKRNECTSSQHEVQICEIQGGGHYWPGQNESVGFCADSLQNDNVQFFNECKKDYKELNWGNELIWDFLKQHQRT